MNDWSGEDQSRKDVMGRTWKSDYTRPEADPWWESTSVADVEDSEAVRATAA